MSNETIMDFVLNHEASFKKSDEELQILDTFHELKRGELLGN